MDDTEIYRMLADDCFARADRCLDPLAAIGVRRLAEYWLKKSFREDQMPPPSPIVAEAAHGPGPVEALLAEDARSRKRRKKRRAEIDRQFKELGWQAT